MSRVNDVHAGMWGEEDFLDLSAPAKLLYVWSFTNPLCGMSGVYRVARRVMAFETGLSPEGLDAALEELAGARFVVYADGAMFVRTRVKHLRMRTKQIAKSIASDVRRLGVDHPVRETFMAEYGGDDGWPENALRTELFGASKEPPQEPQVNLGGTSVEVQGQGQGQGQQKNNQNAGRANGRKRVTYLRRLVPDAVLALAADLVAEFDRQAGTTTRLYDGLGEPTDSYRLVFGAVLREPDRLTAETGPLLIRDVLADPWWEGQPSLGVVFGQKVLERNLQRSAGRKTVGGRRPDDPQTPRWLSDQRAQAAAAANGERS